MSSNDQDRSVVTAKPSRLAPLKKSPTSKASVESFFQEHKIKDLLQDLTSDLAVNQPADPKRHLYNKLGSFFGLQEVAEAEDDKERALLIRMHVEVVTKANTGRAHYIRRATLKDGDKLLFRTWEKEAMAQLNDCVNRALGEPSVSGQSPAEAEIAALKDRVSELERLLTEARKSGGGSAQAAGQAASLVGSGAVQFSLPQIDPAFDGWLSAQLAASPADSKDTEEFKYITFTELPPFTDKHKSLMRKNMTPELFAKLKGVKTSKGITLSNGMQAGVLRPHLGVGFTCGDEECFELFKEIINPIVKGWHGFDPATQTHASDLDYSKLVFSAEDAALFAKYVKSTRIRAARNISGFSLPAGSSKEDRLAVEEVLKSAFSMLPDNLKGTYYPLGGLSGAQEDELQAGGFLFQKPGPMQLLGAAGAGRDWPSGRGIFHNPSKTVLCWCNEEDQCRIIAMENGGDVKGVFTRFCQLSNAIKEAAEKTGKKLMEHPNYGFLGTCPSNLGTGLRGSVMIVLPELNKDPHKLEEICSGFDLQPRGSSGEHSAAVGAKWDISNKQRIGFSEVQLVQKMIDGVKKLIAIEEGLANPKFTLPVIDPAFDGWLSAQLAASPADSKDTEEFKYITFTELPPFTDKHKSLMRKNMTPELFATLKGVKTSKGITLSNGMQAGVLRPHLGVGFTCGDEECFELFKEIINPIVKGWHGFDPATQTHASDLDYSKLVFSAEDAALFAKYVKSTRIRAARNISGFSLPAGSSKEDRLAVEEVLKSAFSMLPDNLKGTYYPLGGLSGAQEDELQAGGFLFQKPGPMQLLGAAGAGRDWPSGRGIFHNPSKTVLCWCNEEDQCRIIAMENGGDVKGVFTRFCQLSNAIKEAAEKTGKKLMEHPNYGFLGTCPSNLGTGLRGSVMIVLPELNKDPHKLEEICSGFDLQPRGSSGEHSAAVGAKWDISNKQRIGFSEVQLVQKMIDGVKKLIAIEEGLANPKFTLPVIDPAFDGWLSAQLAASPADSKDTEEFKYITFTELPPFTDKHKSLMRKNMTPELFAKLKGVKTSKGITLSNGMQAGVLRPHLGVGFTCGDEECFELFKEIINPIVKGWHGFDPATQTHASDLDYSKLVFSAEDAALFAKYVKSTRIRAARNISGFSLPAGSSKEDRLAVEEVLKSAFSMLPDNLKGTYYPLGGLSGAQEDELQAGGFLFQKPGPMQLLGAAGAGRDWPSGRGIFHNPSKTVLCWCNEEDQCRIIAMENGGDVKGVFTRFCQLSNAIKEAAEKTGKKLMEHPNYGFLGTCPSNLGTGLRGSVMIVLPELNKDPHKLEEICSGFDLQPRGSSGEHSAAVGAKWDISNKQRIGFSEVQLVQKMIDGVKKLIAIEEGLANPKFTLPVIDPAFDGWLSAQLAASPADSKDTEEFKYITFTELPPFTDKHKSLMRKNMTPELFAKLKGVKTSKGITLSNGMQAGVLRPHLGVGFTCGDEECFELFKEIINPIVKGWHGFDPATQTHASDLDYSKLVFSAEDAALFAKYVKSTRIRAARNISGFSLPAGSSKEDRLAVEEVLKSAFSMLPDNLKGTYYPLGGLSGAQEDELQAGGFLFQKPGPMQLLGAAGAGRDWPSGRGIFHNPSKTVLCWCNEEDQCRIIAMENGGDVKGVFTRFCQLSNAIKEAAEKTGKKLMEHPNYGFLGTCPSNLGTGLRGSVMIVLPELNKDPHKLEEICSGFDLQPRGSSGEHSAAVGAKWDISNKQRIGFSEVQLVQKMIDGVKKLIAIEEGLANPKFTLPVIDPAFDGWLSAQLAASPADSKDTEEFKYITFTELPPFTDKHKSLMRKNMTPELFAKLKGVKTSKGITLSNGMQAGVLRPHLGVGFTCGDEECFELFKEIINPIVKGWHGFDPATQTHASDLDYSKLVFSAEDAALFAKYVKSTRIRAARNISGFSLPAGSSKEDRLAVEEVLKSAFSMLPDNLKGTYYPLGGLSGAQEDELQAGGFLFQKPGPMQLLGAAGAGRDWPSGRGIFHNPSKTVLCWCNEEDQCRIIAMENGGDVKGVFTRFCQLSNAIKEAAEKTGKKLMEHPNYGFLGTCPSNLGTGLRGSVMIVLPELNKDPHKLEEICSGFDLQPRGSSGEHSAAVGAKWDISNKQRIGFSEVQLVQKMIDGVKKLIAIEEGLANPKFTLPVIDPAFDGWLSAQLAASPADSKDTEEFKYITFTELPPFTDKHKSLMRKNMTPELFAKLKGVKTSKGITLSNGMQAGVLRPHLGVGFTCGDEECFELFKEIINPIVKGWHGFDPATQTHASDLDYSKLVFSAEDAALFAKYVKSTRIRAARNISGFSLPAGSSKEDRLAVEEVLKSAFSMLPDNLKGTYYPLGGLSGAQEDELQAGGFLFQKPGPMQLLGAAGAGRDWPSGRGIFHNPSKTVLCWCNEEDQCRIIAMENGGDVKGVFTRFCQLSNAIKEAAEKTGKKLMEHPNYGFLGTCPSNLGTGLRGSVMIVLPELNKDPHKLEEICSGFDLQPRGSSGEHSAAVGAKWDISNKQRIGFSEVQLVQKMIDGVKKLIAIEEGLANPKFTLPVIDPAFDGWLSAQLAASPADSKDTEEFKYITFTELPPFTDKHKSLMRKNMTPELFAKLKGVKTSKGITLSNGMQAGVLRPHLGVGFTCGDEECFELFKEIINPIVKGWHGFDPATQTHASDLDYSKLVFSAEDAALFAKYVKSTRIRAARNISGFSLPAGSSKEDRLAVEEVLKSAFSMLPDNLKGTYYPLGGLSGAQEDELQAGGFLFQKPGPMQLLGAAGAGRDWPSGRGIFHNPSKTVLCWCNEEDQCRIIAMENGGDVKGVFTRFCQLSNAIKEAAEKTGKKLMEHPNYGFLGTCPSNLGTGLRGSVMIVLPELNKDPHKLEEICSGFDLQPRGSSGEHSAAVGAKWDISNKQRIGFSEVQLVQKMIDGVKKLIAIEEQMAASSQ